MSVNLLGSTLEKEKMSPTRTSDSEEAALADMISQCVTELVVFGQKQM